MFAIKVVEKYERQLLKAVPTSYMQQFTLHIDALFEHFKQIANKLGKTCVKKLHCTALIQQERRRIACSIILEIAPDSPMR